MSIVIDRADNIIVNQGGVAHRTGWVRVTVQNAKGECAGYALAKGKGQWGENINGVRTTWHGTLIRFQGELTLKKFTSLTGWSVPDARLYLWQAEQSEPGMTGVRYAVTVKPTPPEDLRAVSVPGGENLVYAESLYGDWELIGRVSGRAVTTIYGEEAVEMQTPALHGQVFLLHGIVQRGWYEKA